MRRSKANLVAICDQQHLVELDIGTSRCVQLLDLEDGTLADAILLSTGNDDGVHLLDSKFRIRRPQKCCVGRPKGRGVYGQRASWASAKAEKPQSTRLLAPKLTGKPQSKWGGATLHRAFRYYFGVENPSTLNQMALEAIKTLMAADLTQVDRVIRERLSSDVTLINQVAEYIIAGGGKRLRPLVVVVAARACGYTGHLHAEAAAIIELIHTATLLHDDVVD